MANNQFLHLKRALRTLHRMCKYMLMVKKGVLCVGTISPSQIRQGFAFLNRDVRKEQDFN